MRTVLLVEETENELKLKGYSPRTRKAYLHHIERFARHFEKHPRQLGEEDTRAYFLRLADSDVSRSYHNQAVSAVKFLYNRVLHLPQQVRNLPYLRGERRLPPVLSHEEVGRPLRSELQIRLGR